MFRLNSTHVHIGLEFFITRTLQGLFACSDSSVQQHVRVKLKDDIISASVAGSFHNQNSRISIFVASHAGL